MDSPTAAMVREWATNNVGSAFDFGRYGYPEPEVGDPDHLDGVVLRVVAWIEVMVARKLDGSLTDPGLVALAQDAVLMRTQQVLVGRGNTKGVRDALSTAATKAMRAGDYSRTNRDPLDHRKAGQVNQWADLSDTLLALATPDRRAELLAELTGKVRPIGMTIVAPANAPGSAYPETL